jgi:isoleucyl-tRNA synthetase
MFLKQDGFYKNKKNDIKTSHSFVHTLKNIFEEIMPLIGFVLINFKHLLFSRFDFHLQNVLDFHHLGTHKYELSLVKLLKCKINNTYAQCDYNAPCGLPKINLAIADTTLAMVSVSLETPQ